MEDDPNHKWSEFDVWYRHCIVASMLFPECAAYEVMPWPDRIFMPGHSMGGGTPAPENYRVTILSALQAQQEVPIGGEWERSGGPSTTGLGVLVADTLMWEKEKFPMLQAMYGSLMPLVQAGVPVHACVAERAGEPLYLSQFKVIVLSYEALKPQDAALHDALVRWVRDLGGCLVVLGPAEDIGPSLWWHKAGFDTPLQHLLAALGLTAGADADRPVGKGLVLRRTISTKEFGQPDTAARVYLPLIDTALRKTAAAGGNGGKGLATNGSFCMRRGPFIIAHATRKPLNIRGPLVDIFDPELPVRDTVTLLAGQSGLYRDVSNAFHEGLPTLLHATHRLVSQDRPGKRLRFTIRGPAGTPAVARVLCKHLNATIAARDTASHPVRVEARRDGDTVLLKFPNAPEGVALEITAQ